MTKMTSPAELLKRMQDLDLGDSDYDLMLMLYGGQGGGKTTTGGAMAQMLTHNGKIALLDSSDGYVSLRNLPGLTTGVQRIRCKSYSDLYGYAEARSRGITGFDHDVVIIDELSSMANDVLDDVVMEKNDNDINAEVDWTYYRPAAQRIMTVLNKLHDVEGLHVIVVAHQKATLIRPKPPVNFVSPNFSPKMADRIGQIMHVVAHCSRIVEGSEKDVSYRFLLQCQLSKLVEAKSRVGGMPTYMEPVDFVGMIAEWVSSEQIASDTAAEEAYHEPDEDMLPEGITAIDLNNTEDDNDEPAFSGPVE